MSEPHTTISSTDGAFDSECAQYTYSATTSQKYAPKASTLTVMPTSDGDMMWLDGAGNSCTIKAGTTGQSELTLPAVVSGTLADISSSQRFSNKTCVSSDGNVVEATKILGFDVSGDPFTPTAHGTIQYDSVNNKWNYVPAVSAASPLSLNPSTNVVSASVGGTTGTLCAGDDQRFSRLNTLTVKKNPGYGEYGTLLSAFQAIDSFGDASEDNRYLVVVTNGVYSEPELIVPDFVTVRGDAVYNCIIEADSPDHDVMILGSQCELNRLYLRGSTGTGKTCVRYTGLNAAGQIPVEQSWAQITKVQMDTTCCCVNFEAACDSQMFLEYVEIYGPYKYGVVQVGTTFSDAPLNTKPNVCHLNIESGYFSSNCDTTDFDSIITITGPGCVTRMVGSGVIYANRSDLLDVPAVSISQFAHVQIQSLYVLNASMFDQVSGGKGLVVSNGSGVTGTAVLVYMMNYGLTIESGGSPVNFDAEILTASSAVECIRVDSINAFGNIKGNANMNKTFINSSNTSIAINIYDTASQQPRFTAGDLVIGYGTQPRLPLAKFCTMQDVGLFSGGVLSVTGDMTISMTEGSGYVMTQDDNYIQPVNFSQQSMTLTGFNTTYDVYVDYTGTLVANTFSRSLDECKVIPIGKVTTNDTKIVHYKCDTSDDAGRRKATYLSKNLSSTIGCAVSYGMYSSLANDVVTVGNGGYCLGHVTYEPTGGAFPSTPFRLVYLDTDLATWICSDPPVTSAGIPHTTYNPTGVGGSASLGAGYYARHAMYVSGDGETAEQYYLVLGKVRSLVQAELDVEVDANVPQWIAMYCCRVFDVLVSNDGSPSLVKLYDTRPYFLSRIGGGGGGGPGSNDHSALINLLANDHPQYARVDGTNPITGDLNMASHNITQVGTVNGVTVESHASRHLPNTGSDPLALGAAFGSSTVSASSTASRGVANAFALSDHEHPLNVSAVPITGLSGTLTVAKGGTGKTSFQASRFVTTDGGGALTDTLATGTGDVVFTQSTQALTNKTITDETNVVYSKQLWSNTVYNQTGTTETIDTSSGPSPSSAFSVLCCNSSTATPKTAGWISPYDLYPTFYFEQDSTVNRPTSAGVWVTRYIDRLIFDPAQHTSSATNPWNINNLITLTGAGTTNATFVFAVPSIWEIDVIASAYSVTAFCLGLYNVTTAAFFNYRGSAIPAYSVPVQASTTASASYSTATLKFRFEIPTANTQVRLRQYSQLTNANGQGSIAGTAHNKSCIGSFTLLKLL